MKMVLTFSFFFVLLFFYFLTCRLSRSSCEVGHSQAFPPLPFSLISMLMCPVLFSFAFLSLFFFFCDPFQIFSKQERERQIYQIEVDTCRHFSPFLSLSRTLALLFCNRNSSRMVNQTPGSRNNPFLLSVLIVVVVLFLLLVVVVVPHCPAFPS